MEQHREKGIPTFVIRELAQTVVLGLLIFFLVQVSLQNFKVEGASMEPNVHSSERILVNKLVYLRLDRSVLAKFLPFVDSGERAVYPFHQPRRGEVVVFRFPLDPRRNFIKRVIGLPGDLIEIRSGQVYVNGEPLQEDYIQHRDTVSMPQRWVPAGHYFVMGDNRSASNDSRSWGPVPEENIIGKAWLSYWPQSAWGLVKAVSFRLAEAK